MTETAVSAVAAAGLDGDRAGVPLDRSGDDAWSALLVACGHQRLLGLLEHAVLTGSVVIADHQREQLIRATTADAVVAVQREAAAIAVHDRLDAAGVEHRFLKGPSVAHRWYPNPAWRSFADVDVLVRGPDLDATAAALAAAGYERATEQLRAGFDARFGKGMTLACEGLEVDVHRTLAPGPFGARVVLDDLFVPTGAFLLGGRTLPALPLETAFVHTCLHAVLTWPRRLVPIRDVAQLARARPDTAAVDSLTRRWRMEAVVETAHALVRDELGADLGPLEAWARTVRSSAADRDLIGAYRARGRTFSTMSWHMLGELPWRERIPYLAALGLPSSAHLESRDLPRRQLAQRQLRAVFALGRRR
jgi:hypothetical protein